jgi:hypothetical protein
MKDIFTILSGLEIAIPEDKKDDLRKAVSENYKTVAEYQKKVDALEKAEGEAKVAKEAIAKFDGIDPEKIKNELETYKKAAKDAEDKYKADTEARLFNEAAEELLKGYTFSSNAAKSHVMARLKESGLKVIDGAIMGGKDFMTKLQGEDADAFKATDAPRFTTPANPPAGGKLLSKSEIMKIKDHSERQKAWGEYLKANEG